MKKYAKLIIVLGQVLLLFISSRALASSKASATFQVIDVAPSSCNITVTNLFFGNYTGTQLDETSTITVTCTKGKAYSVGLNAGLGSGATLASRIMSSGSDALTYGLYQDSNRTLNWGNTVGNDTVSGTGSGSTQNIPVYGRIPANQIAPAGTYSDTVTVTVYF
jgi:spore coat protein U-like protein